MISDPDLFLDAFVEAGFNSFLVHWEGNNNLHRTVHRVKGLGKRVVVFPLCRIFIDSAPLGWR
jgi:ribulose-phosphate 3-epimerase